MPLILHSGLIGDPPSQNLAIRYVTLKAKTGLNMCVLIEVEQDFKDIYHKYMKRVGLMDYVDEYVTPEERIDGIRIDSELNYARTIRVSSINFQNTTDIVRQVESLIKIDNIF